MYIWVLGLGWGHRPQNVGQAPKFLRLDLMMIDEETPRSIPVSILTNTSSEACIYIPRHISKCSNSTFAQRQHNEVVLFSVVSICLCVCLSPTQWQHNEVVLFSVVSICLCVCLLPAQRQHNEVVLFSVVSICLCVCLSLNGITLELFEILSWHSYGSKIWSNAQTSSKMAALWRTAMCGWRFNALSNLV